MGGFASFWLGRAISHGRTTLTIWRNGRKAAKSRKAHRKQKVDRAGTAMRCFLDKRSFVNLEGQSFLFGNDMQVQHDVAMSRDGWKCVHCGAADSLQVHHKQSRGMLGSDDLANLETICADCHLRKHPQVQLGLSGGQA